MSERANKAEQAVLELRVSSKSSGAEKEMAFKSEHRAIPIPKVKA